MKRLLLSVLQLAFHCRRTVPNKISHSLVVFVRHSERSQFISPQELGQRRVGINPTAGQCRASRPIGRTYGLTLIVPFSFQLGAGSWIADSEVWISVTPTYCV